MHFRGTGKKPKTAQTGKSQGREIPLSCFSSSRPPSLPHPPSPLIPKEKQKQKKQKLLLFLNLQAEPERAFWLRGILDLEHGLHTIQWYKLFIISLKIILLFRRKIPDV